MTVPLRRQDAGKINANLSGSDGLAKLLQALRNLLPQAVRSVCAVSAGRTNGAKYVKQQELSSRMTYDIIVIGAGHAGIEAALAASRMGANAVMLTGSIDNIGLMSCNPAVGGLAKGNLVKDMDALGGEMAKCIDDTGIQFRVLNKKKGAAVWSSRAQADKKLYRDRMIHAVLNQPNLTVFQALVNNIYVENGRVTGVGTRIGVDFRAPKVIVAAGTFLRGELHIGTNSYPGGRMNEFPSTGVSECFISAGIELHRFRTDTTARLHIDSLNLNGLDTVVSDNPIRPFSFETESVKLRQLECYSTFTNAKTHEIIREGMLRSNRFNGTLHSMGPRYCPAIEDKVMRFAERERHQIILEREGLDSSEVYVNGMTTSLPYDVQVAMHRSIKGLENAVITRPGYSVEYDFINPTELKHSLETKKVEGLYCAGQVNGTSGYEEAACQGLIAGINAVFSLDNKEPLILSRADSYIGVLIDDLVTKGTDEPYRMFSSRGEHRLLLREDNAEYRLMEKGYNAGLVSDERYKAFLQKRDSVYAEIKRLEKTIITPSAHSEKLAAMGVEFSEAISAKQLLKRQNITYDMIYELVGGIELPRAREEAEILVKYEGYIYKQAQEIEKNSKIEHVRIPQSIIYEDVHGLRNEQIEKLNRIRPETIGQAGRIPGMTPAALSLLHIYVDKMR